ncbi:9118_t:CDS:2, partial [Racocetra fulgida]
EISSKKYNFSKDDTLTISTTISTTESNSNSFDDDDDSFEDLDHLINERHIKVTNCEAHFEDSEPDPREQFKCHWNVPAPKFDKNGHYINNDKTNTSEKKFLVTCLNEQISHHPPVSAFHYHCEET